VQDIALMKVALNTGLDKDPLSNAQVSDDHTCHASTKARTTHPQTTVHILVHS
jgi:hypothetical protein